MTGPDFRHPTPEEKARELRLYLVVRVDLPLTRADLVRLAARTTWHTLCLAEKQAPDRFSGYCADLQPKIAVRVKSEAQLRRALDEATRSDLPACLIDAGGTPVMAGIGPVTRGDLPSFVAKLQILSAPANVDGSRLPSNQPSSGPRLWIAVRGDIDIPFGKLAAQAGHGAWPALSSARQLRPGHLADWAAAGFPVVACQVADLPALQATYKAARDAGLPASFITDVGRTVFAQPTPTVVGFGPCFDTEAPDVLRLLTPLAN